MRCARAQRKQRLIRTLKAREFVKRFIGTFFVTKHVRQRVQNCSLWTTSLGLLGNYEPIKTCIGMVQIPDLVFGTQHIYGRRPECTNMAVDDQ